MAWSDVPRKSSLRDEHTLRLLLVEDTQEDAELILSFLKRAGYAVSFTVVDLPDRLREELVNAEYDLIVSDHNLRTWTGLDALEILHASQKDIPFVVVTGALGDQRAVDYIKRGAADYVLKDRLNLLPLAVGHVLKERADREETKRLHEQIIAEQRDWELTFDSVPDAVLILDEQCRVRRANLAAAALVEMPFSKFIGQPCYEVLHGLPEAPSSCPHKQLLSSGEPQRTDFEEPHLGKTFDVTSTPLRSDSGMLQGCIHVLRDISDRSRAKQALRNSEEQLRMLLNSTAEAIYGLDNEGTHQ